MQAPSEKRSIVRLPCSIATHHSDTSASLGTITDISLDGVHLLTTAPLPQGSVLPFRFKLGEKGPEVKADVEVVRVTPGGMGLRFVAMNSQDSRRLRRYVTELANIVGNRLSAQFLGEQSDRRTTVPFTDSHKIKALLQSAAGSAFFTVISQSQALREKARLTSTSGDTITLTLEQSAPFKKVRTSLFSTLSISSATVSSAWSKTPPSAQSSSPRQRPSTIQSDVHGIEATLMHRGSPCRYHGRTTRPMSGRFLSAAQQG